MRFSTLLTAGLFLAVTSVFGAPFEVRLDPISTMTDLKHYLF